MQGVLIGTTYFGLAIDAFILSIGDTLLVAAGGYLFSKIQV